MRVSCPGCSKTVIDLDQEPIPRTPLIHCKSCSGLWCGFCLLEEVELNTLESNKTWGGWPKKCVIRRTPPERVEHLDAFLQQIDDLLTPELTPSQCFLSSLTIRCGVETGEETCEGVLNSLERGAAVRN